LLSASDRRWIQAEDIMAVCPLLSERSSRLDAIVALKMRRNALGLSDRDLQFLEAVCGSASLAQGNRRSAQGGRPQEELALQCRQCLRVDAWSARAELCPCGAPWERAALPLVIGDRYRLDQLLGMGGMGVVYRASDLLLKRPVAIKTLSRLSVEASARLLDEARAMGAFSHQHIAVLYGAEQWCDTPLLLVEYLGGGTLAKRLCEAPLSARDAVDTVFTLTQTLVYMHAMNRSHGDIKPTNIAFTLDGTPKFLDFGLSRNLNGDELQHVGGTLAYLSPEALNGECLGPEADLWALSVVLFEAVTGFHPFIHPSATTDRIKTGLTEDGAIRARVPKPLMRVLCDCLNRSPEARPPTASVVLECLARVRTSLADDGRKGSIS
jgi:serine/threonine protein kinase